MHRKTILSQIMMHLLNAVYPQQAAPKPDFSIRNLDQSQKSILAEFHIGAAYIPSLEIGLNKIVEAAQTLTQADDASIILWDNEQAGFYTSATTVTNQEDSTPAKRVRKSGGATHWITQNQQSYAVPDIRTDIFGANKMLDEYGYNAYLGTPIIWNGLSLGVMYNLYKSTRTFESNEVEFARQLANYASDAIQTAILAEQSQKQIETLTDLVAKKGESLRIAEEKLVEASEYGSNLLSDRTKAFQSSIADAQRYVDLLIEEGPAKRDAYLAKIKNALNKLNKLIQN